MVEAHDGVAAIAVRHWCRSRRVPCSAFPPSVAVCGSGLVPDLVDGLGRALSAVHGGAGDQHVGAGLGDDVGGLQLTPPST